MMRSTWLVKLVLALSVLAAAPPLRAQQDKNEDPGVRAPRGLLPSRLNYQNNEFSLLDFDVVQKELNLTDDQKSKVNELCSAFQKAARPDPVANPGPPPEREAILKALKESAARGEQFARENKPELLALLNDEQKTRVTQIMLQAQGRAVYTRPEVQERLEFTTEQKQKLAAIQEEYTKKSQEQFAAVRQPGANREEFTKTRKELLDNWNRACQDVLTPEQKDKLETMKGKAFDLSLLQVTPFQRPRAN
jgi:Spy/CpxP family protein refolding chaperone